MTDAIDNRVLYVVHEHSLLEGGPKYSRTASSYDAILQDLARHGWPQANDFRYELCRVVPVDVEQQAQFLAHLDQQISAREAADDRNDRRWALDSIIDEHAYRLKFLIELDNDLHVLTETHLEVRQALYARRQAAQTALDNAKAERDTLGELEDT